MKTYLEGLKDAATIASTTLICIPYDPRIPPLNPEDVAKNMANAIIDRINKRIEEMSKVKIFLSYDNCHEKPHWCEVVDLNNEDNVLYATTWYNKEILALEDAEKWCKDNGMEVV